MAKKTWQMIAVVPRGGGEVHATSLSTTPSRTACGDDCDGWVIAPMRRDGQAPRVTCGSCKRRMFLPVADDVRPLHAGRGRGRRR